MISNPLKMLLNKASEDRRQGLIFTYAGKPVKVIRDSIKSARQKSDTPYGRFVRNGFVFHDLRHTFNVNARRAGVHKNVAMAIMGHSSGNDMNAIYNTVDDSDLLDAVNKVEDYLQSVRHSVRHRSESGKNNNIST